MNAPAFFEDLFQKRKQGDPVGIYSVCSAHPVVLQAAMEQAAADNSLILIEATANQVNQWGGYTGMTPEAFAQFVQGIAQACSFPAGRILLGGDHLGPLTWREKPEKEAMPLAEELVRQYVLAGFGKIHLDTSMHLADDDQSRPLADETVARRGAALCLAAEKAAQERVMACPGAALPVYVIGSEVPTPGGMQQVEDTVTPTTPEAFQASYNAFESTFKSYGLADAFQRVVAFVVQPGVEFSGERVFDYERAAAESLCASLGTLNHPMVFEGHSTDYQRPEKLREMVEDGIAILKVGPGLTFALREGLEALELMEKALLPGTGLVQSNCMQTLEQAMLEEPGSWKNQYTGSAESQRLQRQYSYYDRARYYLAKPGVAAAIEVLLQNLRQTGIPLNVLSQFLPRCYTLCREGVLAPEASAILRQCVRNCLQGYAIAVKGNKDC